MKTHTISLLGSLLAASFLQGQIANPSTVWELDGNLNTAIGTADPLAAVGGWSASYEAFDGSAGSDALVFPEFSASEWLFADTADLPANGGGSFVNNYTIMMDLKFDDAEQWIGLYQTNENNTNDGDSFIDSDGAGIGISGDYGDAPQFDFIDDTWYRIAIVNDLSAGAINYYVDGVLVNTVSSILTQDGRWSLYPDTSVNGVLLLADNSGTSETGSGSLNSVALWDVALTGSQVADFGAADVAGISAVPEPSAFGLLLGIASMAFLGVRRKR